MSPEETIPFPHQNRYADTPESLQECLSLVGHIDTLLTMWQYAAHHPSGSPLRIAELINDDCRVPEGEPEDYLSQTGFGGKYTHDQAQYLGDRDAARRALVDYIDDPALDELLITDDIVAQYIDMIQTFSNNPLAPEPYKEAVVKLRRAIVLREQLDSGKTTPREQSKDRARTIEVVKSLAGSLL